MMNKILLITFALLVTSCTKNNNSQSIHKYENTNKITTRTIPDEFKNAYQFLEFIKWDDDSNEGFNAVRTPHWDLQSLLKFISENGIIISDINENSRKNTFSFYQIKSQLTKRNGKVFTTISHLGSIYGIPYKQYSELSFERQNQLFIVNISHWYRLVFIHERNNIVLKEIYYLEMEGD